MERRDGTRKKVTTKVAATKATPEIQANTTALSRVKKIEDLVQYAAKSDGFGSLIGLSSEADKCSARAGLVRAYHVFATGLKPEQLKGIDAFYGRERRYGYEEPLSYGGAGIERVSAMSRFYDRMDFDAARRMRGSGRNEGLGSRALLSDLSEGTRRAVEGSAAQLGVETDAERVQRLKRMSARYSDFSIENADRDTQSCFPAPAVPLGLGLE